MDRESDPSPASSNHEAASSPARGEGTPAATIIIYRHCPDGGPAQVLMTVRSRDMAFAGGMAVFPGGRVDPEDFELAQKVVADGGTDLPVDEAAHQIAAIRETLEETGLALGLAGDISAQSAAEARALLEKTGALGPVLEKFCWSLDFAAITPFARWFPKSEQLARVYDTRFYLADLGTGDVAISIDRAENTRLFWTSPQAALEMAARGEIKLIFPTRRNLERLALFNSFEEARMQALAIPVRTITPQIDTSNGTAMLRILEDAGYPVTSEPLESASRG
ncbi:MAG: NUDIX domain-containing protein [Erythrobacter sp.]|nr:NUDIX domain-containing protein [Erythrobacter sp.]